MLYISEGITDYFSCNIGTRQGDVTSTTLFSLFINELSILLHEKCNYGIFIDSDIEDIICLIFADDVANCAETVNRLQQQINAVDQFCKDFGMEVNLKKTEIIVYRNGGHLRK